MSERDNANRQAQARPRVVALWSYRYPTEPDAQEALTNIHRDMEVGARRGLEFLGNFCLEYADEWYVAVAARYERETAAAAGRLPWAQGEQRDLPQQVILGLLRHLGITVGPPPG